MKSGCSIGIFLNTAHLICRSTDISKCFRGSLRLRDNESRLYMYRRAHALTLFVYYTHILTHYQISDFGDQRQLYTSREMMTANKTTLFFFFFFFLQSILLRYFHRIHSLGLGRGGGGNNFGGGGGGGGNIPFGPPIIHPHFPSVCM